LSAPPDPLAAIGVRVPTSKGGKGTNGKREGRRWEGEGKGRAGRQGERRERREGRGEENFTLPPYALASAPQSQKAGASHGVLWVETIRIYLVWRGAGS